MTLGRACITALAVAGSWTVAWVAGSSLRQGVPWRLSNLSPPTAAIPAGGRPAGGGRVLGGEARCGQGLLFEVMELVLQPLLCEPVAGFLDGVAIRNAVDGDSGSRHAAHHAPMSGSATIPGCMHTNIHSLAGWLGHCERLHPRAIDMGLERVREVARRMALRFDCPVITV